MSLPQKKEIYTYADYCLWDDGERFELIEGIPYAMSPSLSQVHQEISVALSSQIYRFLKGKSCKIFTAPFDVRLNDQTVVQPDLLIVCDKSKLDGKYVVSMYGDNENLSVHVLKGCHIDLSEVFTDGSI